MHYISEGVALRVGWTQRNGLNIDFVRQLIEQQLHPLSAISATGCSTIEIEGAGIQ